MTTSLAFAAPPRRVRSRLKELMEVRKIPTLSELARVSKVSYPTISSLYHGRASGITWPVLEKLCATLECTPGDLLVVEDAPAEAAPE